MRSDDRGAMIPTGLSLGNVPIFADAPRRADFAAQLRAFNAERKALMCGQPISGDVRIPGPYTGVGGDVEPPEWAR